MRQRRDGGNQRRNNKQCRERPRRPAAEQRYELASFHVSYDSGLMVAARTTLLHFSVSSAMSLPKSAGEPGSTVPPDSAIRALILGSVRAALVSWLSLSMTPAGVPLGAPRPNQTHWVKRPEGASITSSTRSRNDSGIVRPSALAVVRLMTRSNLVGCSTGMSPGLAPRRILST